MNETADCTICSTSKAFNFPLFSSTPFRSLLCHFRAAFFAAIGARRRRPPFPNFECFAAAEMRNEENEKSEIELCCASCQRENCEYAFGIRLLGTGGKRKRTKCNQNGIVWRLSNSVPAPPHQSPGRMCARPPKSINKFPLALRKHRMASSRSILAVHREIPK